MKLLIQRYFIENVAETEPLHHGNWVSDADGQCTGCMVGNVFLKLSSLQSRQSVYKIQEAIINSTQDELHEAFCVGFGSGETFDPGRLIQTIEKKQYNRALSYCFETLQPGEVRHRSILPSSRIELVKRIKKYFPAVFELEVDGLDVAAVLPEGVSLIQERQ